jgi:5'-methylthioadenosine phosphorylase
VISATAQHHIGIIGGSGLYELPGLAEVSEQTVRTPYGDPSDALITGVLGDTRFYFLPRHGRGHRIPPSAVNYRANIYALKRLGATQVVSVSAVGSLREELRPGAVVLVDQFIDRTHARISTFFDEPGLAAHVGLADPTDASLSSVLADAAVQAGATVHSGGTYLCMEGPQFSTRAESRMYRAWGADVIGMTGMPEAKLAREAELPYACMALVTDYDCWHEHAPDVTVDEIVRLMTQNVTLARQTLASVPLWPSADGSPASSALRDAFLSDRTRVSAQIREKLALLIGKYLPVS